MHHHEDASVDRARASWGSSHDAILDFDFMRRALVAAALVGLIAPLIGVFLVQRRLALLGDGMGHVALTGVGLAFLLGTAPIPTAMATAVLGAFLIEFIRYRSRTAGDVALALLFYGGIAGGVLFASLAPGQGVVVAERLPVRLPVHRRRG